MGTETTLKVHWFDPGVTTGYATGLIERGIMGVVSGQAVWSELDLYLELKRSKPDIIGYETFEYRKNVPTGAARASGLLFPRNLIGVLNLYYQERESQRSPVGLFKQTAAQGKSYPKQYFNDARLKRDGLYKTLRGGHCNDALRHLLYWYQFGAGFQYNQHGYRGLA